MSLQDRWRKWFFRHTSAEPAPIVLDRRRIYILPTRSGLLFAGVLAAMYVGAINYNLGLGHALVFLLVGVGLVGMVHTYRNLVGLELSPGRCGPVFVGETLHYRLVLHNRAATPRFAINLQKNRGRAALASRLDAASDRELTLAAPALARGRQEVGRLRISARYPLGLFEAWSYPYPAATALVYPKPLFTPLPPSSPSRRPGAGGGALGEEDFAGFRLHQPGDSPRHIAWKAYARAPEHQPLRVKTFAGGTDPELWLDWRMAPAGADAETRLSLLCGWALQAERDGLRFGLRLPGAEVAPDAGRQHLDACLERLALFDTRAA